MAQGVRSQTPCLINTGSSPPSITSLLFFFHGEFQWNFAHVNSDDHMQPKSAGNEADRPRATNSPMRTAHMQYRPACGWNTAHSKERRRSTGTLEGTSKERRRNTAQLLQKSDFRKTHFGVVFAIETHIIYVITKRNADMAVKTELAHPVSGGLGCLACLPCLLTWTGCEETSLTEL